uniref:Uncharacterized protein n=1 Tax=Knipowitschia caucasica TaxID=637954 RepID=A0AAV2MIX9_KNICA
MSQGKPQKRATSRGSDEPREATDKRTSRDKPRAKESHGGKRRAGPVERQGDKPRSDLHAAAGLIPRLRKVYGLGSGVAAGGLQSVVQSEDAEALGRTAKRPTRSGGAHTSPAH